MDPEGIEPSSSAVRLHALQRVETISSPLCLKLDRLIKPFLIPCDPLPRTGKLVASVLADRDS